MRVNLGIEITDEQRRTLADVLDGKSTARLASRDDVRDVLLGVLDALYGSDQFQEPVTKPISRVSRMAALVDLELPNYRGKGRSYVIGIVKVKYARELRG